jgi:hypothetical protein
MLAALSSIINEMLDMNDFIEIKYNQITSNVSNKLQSKDVIPSTVLIVVG